MSAQIAARPPSARVAWHQETGEAVLARLETELAGLSAAEAARRLAQHGPNELREAEPIRPLVLLLGQFKSLIVWLLVVAALASGFLGEWADSIAILAIVVVNGAIGFYQEYRAERSLAALRRMTAPRARVRRAGQSHSIPALELVPGDVLELEAGDIVAADARVIEVSSLMTVEAALTGESEAVEKAPGCVESANAPLGDRRNMLYMGTSVASGRGVAVIVETGMATEIGHISQLLSTSEDEEETPLQKRLASVGRLLVWACLSVVALIFVLGLVRGLPPLELLLSSVSLAVAAVPEGLPAVVTVALALGVQRMARRRALMRKLHAVETLGSTSVICSDKTGTLTVGEMTVRALYAGEAAYTVSGEGYGPQGELAGADGARVGAAEGALRELLEVFVGCNGASLANEGGAWKVVGDPTEGALLAVGAKVGVTSSQLERDWPKLGEIPFDSDRKRMTIVRGRSGEARRALVKGAPDVLLARCTHVRGVGGVRSMSAEDRLAIETRIAELTGRGLRVLAAAWKDLALDERPDEAERVESALVFAGLAGMYDPPRPEVKQAIALARSAGIRVVMITGDHPRTALAIARELGLAGAQDLALSGPELERLSDEELRGRVERVAVYARVTAAHKLKIVRAWKQAGGVVAMTGDGVNDAPAIKGADIGIAMGRSGTEVTKEASDMVVTDDNFASIVAAVEEGRGIYDNIKKTMQYLLGGNAGELILMASCVLLGLPLPLLPIQLLWINLVTDGLPALCLATDPIDPYVMRRRPRPRSERLADRRFLGMMLITGLLTASVSLGVYLYALRHESAEMARDHAFSALVYAELLRSFGARSEERTVWEVGLLSNLKLTAVVLLSMALQFLAPHVEVLGAFLEVQSMPMRHCLMLLAVGSLPLIVLESIKLLRRRSAS